MPKLRRVAIVAPRGDFNNNMLPAFAAGLAAAVRSRGLEVTLVDSSHAEFHQQLLNIAMDPATAIYTGHFFFDFSLMHAEELVLRRTNVFDALNRPVFARVADHPYAKFMWARFEGASPTTHFLLPSLEFREEVQFLNPRLTHFHKVPSSVTMAVPDDDRILPLDERPIDIFMPCSVKPVEPWFIEQERNYRRDDHKLAEIIDEVVAVGVADRDRSVMDAFLESIHRHFGKRFVLQRPPSDGDREILRVLSNIDFRIRTARRFAVLESLARIDPRLRVVITMPESLRMEMPALQGRSNIELIGRVDVSRAAALYGDSKFVLNVNPTYHAHVSERICNAMAFGCCVISDSTSHLAKVLPEGEQILFLSDYDLDPLESFILSQPEAAQAIASAGRARAMEDFSLAGLAEEIIAVMEAAL